MTKPEAESISRWDLDETVVFAWTAQRAVRRKLEKAGYRPYRASRQYGKEIGWFYRIPLAEFHWRAGAKPAGTRKTSPKSLVVLAEHRAKKAL